MIETDRPRLPARPIILLIVGLAAMAAGGLYLEVAVFSETYSYERFEEAWRDSVEARPTWNSDDEVWQSMIRSGHVRELYENHRRNWMTWRLVYWGAFLGVLLAWRVLRWRRSRTGKNLEPRQPRNST